MSKLAYLVWGIAFLAVLPLRVLGFLLVGEPRSLWITMATLQATALVLPFFIHIGMGRRL